MDRSFEIHGVAPDISPQSWVRLVLSELQERQLSASRMTHIWPKHSPINQALGPAKIVIVLQSDGAQEAALIFHMNERFLHYSWNRQGLRCQEPRTDRTNYAMRHERLAEWNMEEVWDRLGNEEMHKRERLRRHNGLHPGQAWGRLTNMLSTSFLYQLDNF